MKPTCESSKVQLEKILNPIRKIQWDVNENSNRPFIELDKLIIKWKRKCWIKKNNDRNLTYQMLKKAIKFYQLIQYGDVVLVLVHKQTDKY